MQLRGFRHAVRHARAVGPYARDRRRDDERAAVGVRVEGRQGGAYEVRLGAHVDGEASVPVGGGGRGEVGEGAEARVALRMCHERVMNDVLCNLPLRCVRVKTGESGRMTYRV